MLFSTFYIEDTHFGLPIPSILEIGRTFKVHNVQGVTSVIDGLINLRGKVVTIINLGEALNIKKVVSSDDARMYILKNNHEISETDTSGINMKTAKDNVGLHIDRMGDVIKVDMEEMMPVPANINHPYYKNIIKRDDDFIIVLDLEKLLNLTDNNIVDEGITNE